MPMLIYFNLRTGKAEEEEEAETAEGGPAAAP